MHTMTFRLAISADQYQRYYSGSAKYVKVTTDDGRTLRFPANNLQQFVAHDGVNGHFEMRFDKDHRIVGFRRIG